MQDGTRIRSQEAEQRTGRGIDSRSQFSPMSSGDGRTAIAVSSAHRLYLAAVRAVIVHRLPHAAGMRQRRRDRHAYGDKDPREQKNQQASGGQTMHGQATNAGHKHRGGKPSAQVTPGTITWRQPPSAVWSSAAREPRRVPGPDEPGPHDTRPRPARNCGALLRRTAGGGCPHVVLAGSISSAPSARRR